jgi:excisionase family DNA binding protein
MQRRTLTVQDVAEYLGVHQDTIYNMVRQKEIPHFRVRRRILFTIESIDAWIRQSESEVIIEAM